MNKLDALSLAAHGGPGGGLVRDAPAFDFYPERWLVGVAAMSDAEQLSYLRLLCHQWLLGDAGLPPDVPALKRLAGKGVSTAVLAKLPAGADGRRRNARLEIIRREQRERIAKASERARRMAAGRWNKTGAPPMPKHAASNAQALPDEGSPHQRVHAAGNAQALLDECPPPTADHPPPTHVPEDANNAGAREAAAASEAAAAAAQAAAAKAAQVTPSLATVQAWAVRMGCPPDKAQIWWHEHEARPLSLFGCWTDRDGNAVQRPQHALAAWWQKWQANDHQRATRLHPGAARAAPARSDTANAPGRYA